VSFLQFTVIDVKPNCVYESPYFPFLQLMLPNAASV